MEEQPPEHIATASQESAPLSKKATRRKNKKNNKKNKADGDQES